MSFSLARSLHTLRDPALRNGTDLRGLLVALHEIARSLCARGAMPWFDGDDLVHDCLLRLLVTKSYFSGSIDGEARVYLRRMMQRLAIDAGRVRKRRATTEALVAQRAQEVEGSSHEPMFALAIELAGAIEKIDAELRRHDPDCALLAQLDALGMLPWSERANMHDAELAARLCTTPNALQARRTRLRNAIEQTTERLQRARRMSESERNAMLTLVARSSTERASAPSDRRSRRS
jgi:DNA-directed RNA polymerase specialized sigma24 family protein